LKGLPPVASVRRTQSALSDFLKIHFNVIVPSVLRSWGELLSPGFPNKISYAFIITPSVFHAMRMSFTLLNCPHKSLERRGPRVQSSGH
jgi:hypothetical protein